MSGHLPVMGAEVADGLNLRDGRTYVDCTFGLGGYSRAWLEQSGCTVIAIDRDASAIAAAEAVSAAFGGRFRILEGRFGDLVDLLDGAGIGAVAGVAMDLGVSSPQLDRAERGFSFRHDGPLDMRMGLSDLTAADIVNTWEATDLADLFFRYGEERRSRPIARAIVAARTDSEIRTTGRLAEIVARAVPGPAQQRIHPATRVFQALRIAVNDELGELRRGLLGAEQVLEPGGRLAVVSFHSLEDRMVKRFLTARTGSAARGSRHRPEAGEGRAASFTAISRGALLPTDAEVEANPRARSARLRVAERTSAPAWPADEGFGELAA